MKKTLHRGFKSREGRVKRREKLWVEERRLERSWVTCKNPSLALPNGSLGPSRVCNAHTSKISTTRSHIH